MQGAIRSLNWSAQWGMRKRRSELPASSCRRLRNGYEILQHVQRRTWRLSRIWRGHDRCRYFENVVNQMDIDAKIFSRSAIVLGRAYGFMVISVTPLFWVLDTAWCICSKSVDMFMMEICIRCQMLFLFRCRIRPWNFLWWTGPVWNPMPLACLCWCAPLREYHALKFCSICLDL